MKRIDYFINVLSNWYVRRSRRRFWKSENDSDKLHAYRTLYTVLKTFTQVLAPFLPFISEEMYQNLRTEEDPESVHLNPYPIPDKKLQLAHLSEHMDYVLGVVELGRQARSKAGIKVRQPLPKVFMQQPDKTIDKKIASELESLIKDELNVKEIEYVSDMKKYAKPVVQINSRVLGPKIGGDVQKLIALSRKGEYEIDTKGDTLKIGGHTLTTQENEFTLNYESLKKDFVAMSQGGVVVVLDTHLTQELIKEGYAREIVRAIQDLRKESGFNIEDRIESFVVSSDNEIKDAVEKFKDYLKQETLSKTVSTKEEAEFKTKTCDIDGKKVLIGVKK